MDIFERASRAKLRFPSSVGALTTEQLWDLPLTARGDRPDLDQVARAVNAELKSRAEESFVATTPDPDKAVLELALDVVKHVIAAKLEARATAEAAAANAERKRKLLAALSTKEEQELTGMSKEQIEEEIAKLAA